MKGGVDRAHLFEGLKIADAGEIYQKELGRYPVVMLNFKDGKWPTFEQSYEMISFIRGMLSLALKTNKSLAFAVITGCLRISKESIFTGLNNLQIVSIQDRNYGEFFGFTKEEVYEMLVHYDKPHLMEKIKAWYDGYVFGVTEVYNPWSLLNHMTQVRADENAFTLLYWSNTSSNSIIKDLVLTLEIPNLEVKSVYRRQIMEWVKEQVEQKDMTKLYEAMLSGDAQAIEEEINQALVETISYHDNNESYFHFIKLMRLSCTKCRKVYSFTT